MLAVHEAGVAEIVAVADSSQEAARGAAAAVGAEVVSPEALLDEALQIDGLVIATPSALHAEQAIAALDAGRAVFCQKPLGRTASECGAVVEVARRADLLLAVDLSYRHLAAVARMREVLESGGIGDAYAADLVFHNAYGPDKAWFLDAQLSGGGCVIDLGIHLVDLALWLLTDPKASADSKPQVTAVDARLFAAGAPVAAGQVEDHAMARIDLADGRVVTLACSWFLHAGCDAVITATFYGTQGAVALHNVAGSFYDFRADLHRSTSSEVLALPPDHWGGRAAVGWARRLGAGERFDPAVEEMVEVARVLDLVYGR
ncbi:MAG: Gfo/Idh/MocA family oxidoreductase [Actinobacteria bacterium]|nr:Gfo/Idh/MocA family oxidoreductase [Actinomycetota bacterium]MBW3649863.1 Gfo/Idh/MocA family oxidoreductase [Actinomycetota bacterium]